MTKKVIVYVLRENRKILQQRTMFEEKKLLNEIFTQSNNDKEYMVLEHSDKTWVMPKVGLKSALDMYQPSTFKGKMLKKMLWWCRDIQSVNSKIGVSHKNCKVNETIYKYICEVTGKKDFYVAGYMGDTSSRQNNKATLQIYDDKEIVGYAKITKDEQVIKTFEHEIEALKILEEKEINNVPRVLGADCIDGMHIFIQSTEKSFCEKVNLQFGKQQMEFIKSIVDATEVKLAYEDTDFYKSVQCLKGEADDFAVEEKKIIEKAIRIMEEKLLKKRYDYAFSHGDYTPWNVYYVNGQLKAFDFEYCSYSMPSYLDIFHYFTQLSMLGKKNDVGGTIHIYKKYRKLLEEYIVDSNFTYVCYLVYIISFYKQRTEVGVDISEKYRRWIGILEYLLNKIDE